MLSVQKLFFRFYVASADAKVTQILGQRRDIRLSEIVPSLTPEGLEIHEPPVSLVDVFLQKQPLGTVT
ncbi:hypothetical protein [Starkeya nomas]|uniref:hypothetical protein n=1 Tax=Starkeya nomas TaxID=2666134 RepID=UPI00135B8EBA|nr:hypothetical protein [Starkeya nomas]